MHVFETSKFCWLRGFRDLFRNITHGEMVVEEGNVLEHLDSVLRGASMKLLLQHRRTILPAVSVPVLSEHRTDMHPRVSMVAKFLTNTERFAIRRAMTVNERATQIGKP